MPMMNTNNLQLTETLLTHSETPPFLKIRIEKFCTCEIQPSEAEFLNHHGLVVDLIEILHREIVVSETGLTTKGTWVISSHNQIKTMTNSSSYHDLLATFSCITKQVQHNVQHFIETNERLS